MHIACSNANWSEEVIWIVYVIVSLHICGDGFLDATLLLTLLLSSPTGK